MPGKGDEMSEVERRMADHVASAVVARLLDVMQDKDTAARIMDVWGGEVDRTIGRGLRRALWYLLLALAGIASAKLGLWDKLIGFLKP